MRITTNNKDEYRSSMKILSISIAAFYSMWIIKSFASLTLDSFRDFCLYLPFAYYTGAVFINSLNLVMNFDEFYEKYVHEIEDEIDEEEGGDENE